MATHYHYYVNDTLSADNDHEVHEQSCYWLSIANRKTYLGFFVGCIPAVKISQESHYRNSNGCKHCSPICHTG